MQRGALRRHLLLQECRRWLRAECEKDRGPLGVSEVQTLSLYVNAYYVNLCGALDNVAWTLTHETRRSPKRRTRCVLVWLVIRAQVGLR